MHVACSTLCFASSSLDRALERITELQFTKLDLAVHERSGQFKPSEVVADPERALNRIRWSSPLAPVALNLDIDAASAEEYRKQFHILCRLAKQLTATLVTIPAAAVGTEFKAEVSRLTDLTAVAAEEGIQLTIETTVGRLTEDPDVAVRLCQTIRGLGLTLDPSHYVCGPAAPRNYDQVFPYVYHVHLRDTGRRAGQMQVRIGQGEIEYGRIVSFLGRYGYNRALSVEIIEGLSNGELEIETEVRKLKLLLESLV